MLQDKATSELMSAQEDFSLLLHYVLSQRVKLAETASSQHTPARHYNLTARHFPPMTQIQTTKLA